MNGKVMITRPGRNKQTGAWYAIIDPLDLSIDASPLPMDFFLMEIKKKQKTVSLIYKDRGKNLLGAFSNDDGQD